MTQDLKKKLSKIQYEVTQESGTERPYTGKFYREDREGDYRCICCNHILFDHTMKYDSGCGWPAFHTEHPEAGIKKIQDRSHGMVRTEVRCGNCDSHLGHVFNDGPKDKSGIRYCINSASLTFRGEMG